MGRLLTMEPTALHGYNGSASGSILDILLEDPSAPGLTPYWGSTQYNRTGLAPLLNSTALPPGTCEVTEVPTVAEYLAAVNLGGQLLLALAVSATIFILVLWGDTVRFLTRRAPSRTKTVSCCVVSVYPVVAVATLCASVVPRAQLLAEALTQAGFTAAWYQFFCLAIAYCGGEAALLAARPEVLTPRVPPLCCFWPCMPHTLEITKRNLKILRGLVLQLPAVQCLLYLALLVVWAEKNSLTAVQNLAVVPFMFISIFTGLWGMGMVVRMLAPRVLAGFLLKEKMLVLQLVLVFSKLQGLGIRGAVWGGAFPCRPPLPPVVFGNLIYNTLIMTEMVVLQLVAWRLYKRHLPKAPVAPLAEVGDIEEGGKIPVPSISQIVEEKVDGRGRQ